MDWSKDVPAPRAALLLVFQSGDHADRPAQSKGPATTSVSGKLPAFYRKSETLSTRPTDNKMVCSLRRRGQRGKITPPGAQSLPSKRRTFWFRLGSPLSARVTRNLTGLRRKGGGGTIRSWNPNRTRWGLDRPSRCRGERKNKEPRKEGREGGSSK